jgi:hypothetical protein
VIENGIYAVNTPLAFECFSTVIYDFLYTDSLPTFLQQSMLLNCNQFTFVIGSVQDFQYSVVDNCVAMENGVLSQSGSLTPPLSPNPISAGVLMSPSWIFSQTLIRNSVGHGVHCTGGRYMFQDCKIQNSAGDAINAEVGPNYLILNNCNGAGNGGVGVRATDGAIVQVVNDDVLVSGAGGDMKVGILPLRTWAGFRGADALPVKNQYDLAGMNAGGTDQSTGTRLFQRVLP